MLGTSLTRRIHNAKLFLVILGQEFAMNEINMASMSESVKLSRLAFEVLLVITCTLLMQSALLNFIQFIHQ